MTKYLSAMSGGVDSTVATKLLLNKAATNEVAGVTLALFNKKLQEHISAQKDIKDAENVAEKLGINHFILDFSDSFTAIVIKDFVDTFYAGFTPNPCVTCNKNIKFGRLIDEAISLGYDYVATGHYAKLEYTNGRYLIKRATDLKKDQSYVLYTLSQHQLSHTKFPLGNLNKEEVRNIAESCGFLNADKSDSQDICFISDGDYKKFLHNYTEKIELSGDFVDMDGNILGQHNGMSNYTIGQRRGIELEMNKPIYIVNKDCATGRITIGDKEDLLSTTLIAKNANFIPLDTLDKPIKVSARTRYKQAETAATISMLSKDKVLVEFDAPVSAITPGQSVVFYDGEYLVGGAIITDERI